MGRIITPVTIKNSAGGSESLRVDAMVDTGSAYMVLPSAWRTKLGKLNKLRDVTIQLGDQSTASGEMCGPVEIQLAGFAPFYSEVLFVDMEPHDGRYEPLIGYIPLEQSQAAVDMLGHRLLPVKYVDLK